MVTIPVHIQNLAPYKPGKPGANMFGDNQPEKQVVLSSNENNFGPSPKALEALRDGMSKLHLYPDPTSGQLKEKLSQILEVDSSRILMSNGSDAILYTMFRAFIHEEESMLTSHGAFVSAKVMAKMNDVRCVEVPMLEGYEFDLEGMIRAIDNTTKLIYLVNPNNPTGRMISLEKMVAFLDRIPSHILVVIDEAYFEFAKALEPDYPDCTKLNYDNIIVLRTFSKAYGLAGLRLGYAIGPEYLIQALSKVKLTFDPNLAAQMAGIAALEDEGFLQQTIDNNGYEMHKLKEAYAALGLNIIPSSANFIAIAMKDEEEVERYYHALLAKGVLTRRLGSFGLPHCLRISIGIADENDYMLKQLKIIRSELI